MSLVVNTPASITLSVAGQIQQLATCVKNLIPDTVRKIRLVNRVLDEIERDVTFKCHENPRVAIEIDELKQAFKKVMIYSDHYVVACKRLANYSSNTHHIQSIKDDLEGGSVQKLKGYLGDVSDCIAKCCKHLDEYRNMFEKLQKDTNAAKDKQVSKVERKEKEVKDMHHVSRGTGIAAGATGAMAGFSGAVSAVALSMSVFAPPTAIVGVPIGIVAMIIGGTLATGATASAGTSIGFAVTKSIGTKELDLLIKAGKSLADLQEKMDENKFEMLKLELCVRNTSECVKGSTIEYSDGSKQQIKGLKHHANDPCRCDDGELESLWDIEDKLDEVQAEMQTILEIIKTDV